RLQKINFDSHKEWPEELLVFYHADTLKRIVSLKEYLLRQQASNELDAVDEWIRMIAINRLTGHSSGFFSVYTLPPNQAVSVKSQQKINAQRKQSPLRRHVPELILKKSRQLLADCSQSDRSTLSDVSKRAQLLTEASDHTPKIASNSVSLVVTSPPFLNI